MTSEGKIRIERLKLESVGREAESEPPVSSTGLAGSARHPVEPQLPPAAVGATDERTLRAWRQWLRSMATDAEAAMAAAIAYRQLEAEDRDRWLDSLEADAASIDVPKIALYAPLIAVEHEPERRERLLDAIADAEMLPEPSGRYRALSGRDSRGARVCVVVQPLYLDFVQVLACAHDANGFAWVRHDPIVDVHRAPRTGESLEGARLEASPMKTTIDELASAILAHRRSKRPMPEALAVIEHLFDPADHASP